MPSIAIGIPNSVKTVSKQCQNDEFLDTGYRPLQLANELHQKDLRINPVLVYIWGMVLEGVFTGGHVSGLKSNRPVIGVPQVELAPTY